MADQEEKGFKISDKRRFTSEGEARDESTGTSKVPPKAPSPEEPPAGAPSPEAHDGPGFTAHSASEEGALPEMNFPTFVLSLHASCLVHLGLVADPATKRAPEPRLEFAHQTIEILGMLEEKTRGNLSPEEADLLRGVLYELRMRFVEIARSTRKAG
ncbi:MAG: DUF1844 domain-containing protein [Bdellovibrionota bacterium]